MYDGGGFYLTTTISAHFDCIYLPFLSDVELARCYLQPFFFFAIAPPFARVVSRFGATWFTMILGWGGYSLFVYRLLIARGITRMALLYWSDTVLF